MREKMRRRLWILGLCGAIAILAMPASGGAQEPPDSSLEAEVFPLEYGAELIVLCAVTPTADQSVEKRPLMALLRDTLGDADPTNDLFRYVWVFTYTRPSIAQRVMAAIPFFYHSLSNRRCQDCGPPPPIIDLSNPKADAQESVAQLVIQNLLFDPTGWLLSVVPRTYFRNLQNYKESQLVKAISILDLYHHDRETGQPMVFGEYEMKEISAQLANRGILGAFLSEKYLPQLYYARLKESQTRIANNRDLLRQRAEEQGLFFQPLTLPNGMSAHALLWVSRDAVQQPGGRDFEGRFLNIKNPWTDKRLTRWQGYTKTFYLDRLNRTVEPTDPDARSVEMIPLAIYGLDFPKIPVLLVDFRDVLNPKSREVSQRVVDDSTRYLLGLTPYRDVGYFLVRSVYNYFTRSLGLDVNQPSRLTPYAQLKVLQLLGEILDPDLREIVARDVEKLNLNPLENDVGAEADLCQRQYEALMAYARQDDGLARRVEQDRDREKRALVHSRFSRVMFTVAHVASLGLYDHREEATSEIDNQYRVQRGMKYHKQILREVAATPAPIDVVWDPARVRASLVFINEHAESSSRLLNQVEAIYAKSGDEGIRQLCVAWLYKVNPSAYETLAKRLAASSSPSGGGDR